MSDPMAPEPMATSAEPAVSTDDVLGSEAAGLEVTPEPQHVTEPDAGEKASPEEEHADKSTGPGEHSTKSSKTGAVSKHEAGESDYPRVMEPGDPDYPTVADPLASAGQ